MLDVHEEKRSACISYGNDGAYFKLCEILREFPDTFREHDRKNTSNFD
jgi:hypothetical protein